MDQGTVAIEKYHEIETLIYKSLISEVVVDVLAVAVFDELKGIVPEGPVRREIGQ